jgi:hypothetical protein
MRIVSIDIGIRNLSYAIIDSETCKIEEWGLINLLKNEIKEKKKCDECKSGIYFAYNYVELPKRLNLCKRHTKKYEVVKVSKLDKEYKEVNNEKCGLCEKKGKVKIEENVYCTTHYNQKSKIKKIKTKKVNCNTMPVKTILINQITVLDDEYSHFLDCDKVLIERQPGKKKRMEKVSNNLFSYFLIRGLLNKESSIKEVDYIDASSKLFIYPKKYKNTYKKRKKLSTFICGKYIKDTQEQCIIDVFTKEKKKDDLADALLQCLSHLYKLPKINYDEIKF